MVSSDLSQFVGILAGNEAANSWNSVVAQG
jgi:hypothetical protein